MLYKQTNKNSPNVMMLYFHEVSLEFYKIFCYELWNNGE